MQPNPLARSPGAHNGPMQPSWEVAGARRQPPAVGWVPSSVQRWGSAQTETVLCLCFCVAQPRERPAAGPPRVPPHPSGVRPGARAWNGAETATAGVTDSAARGPASPRWEAELGRCLALPEPVPALAQQADEAVPEGPTDPRTSLRPRLAGVPGRQQSEPQSPAPCIPIPELNIAPLSPGSNLFNLRSRKRNGRGPETPPPPHPALGEAATTPTPHPAPKLRAASRGLPLTHLSCGFVPGSGSSDVRVAATGSRRLPRRDPAGGRPAATANCACACGGRPAREAPVARAGSAELNGRGGAARRAPRPSAPSGPGRGSVGLPSRGNPEEFLFLTPRCSLRVYPSLHSH
nr:nascent polypeptide-associated complex subunit alpha, muscle-specific form [Oryctolagus cuniculus]XP_051675434.1 nascent polypeptide-associated complex subunit alpha, muscle-specific form [Oryctolagus cuniculus]XP_051675435.1 nascent polypeptide-associated complex subunit alpha, muscle-specific form [Oryctolagus cuniculus]